MLKNIRKATAPWPREWRAEQGRRMSLAAPRKRWRGSMSSKALRTALYGLTLASAALVAVPIAVAQKSGGTLRVYQRENPPSASINEEATISTAFPFSALFNNIIKFDPQKPVEGLDTIVPELGKSWSLDSTGTKLTFKLEEGVTWHDGKPFTAKDVVCTWDLINGVTEGARKSPRKIWYDNLDKITADADHQVTFHLKAPQPSFLNLLASGLTPIYPCHVSARDMRTNPIGTGPFKLAEFKRNESIRLVRNPNYWKKGLPYLDAIDSRIIPSRSTRILAFIAGEFDLSTVDDVTIPLLKDVAARAPSAICSLDAAGTYANLMVNRSTPPFDNPQIRRAMMLTLDRKSFVDIMGEGKLGIGGAMMPLPDGRWGMPPEIQSQLPGYAADVEKSRAEARKIMEGLGYGKDKPLKIKVTTRALDSYKDAAVILTDHLKQIYIEGDLFVADSTVWYNVMQKKDYTVALNVTGVGVDDPDANLVENYLCKSERNFTNYCNPEVDKLITEQSKEADVEKRKKIVWEIEKQLAEDAARPVIYHSRTGTCWYPQVKGIIRHQNSIYNQWRFEDVWLDK
jgi:peptide/nickel transport system substrate-binding protein